MTLNLCFVYICRPYAHYDHTIHHLKCDYFKLYVDSNVSLAAILISVTSTVSIRHTFVSFIVNPCL